MQSAIELPADVWSEVFSFLTIKELSLVSECSALFYYAAKKSFFLNRKKQFLGFKKVYFYSDSATQKNSYLKRLADDYVMSFIRTHCSTVFEVWSGWSYIKKNHDKRKNIFIETRCVTLDEAGRSLMFDLTLIKEWLPYLFAMDDPHDFILENIKDVFWGNEHYFTNERKKLLVDFFLQQTLPGSEVNSNFKYLCHQVLIELKRYVSLEVNYFPWIKLIENWDAHTLFRFVQEFDPAQRSSIFSLVLSSIQLSDHGHSTRILKFFRKSWKTLNTSQVLELIQKIEQEAGEKLHFSNMMFNLMAYYLVPVNEYWTYSKEKDSLVFSQHTCIVPFSFFQNMLEALFSEEALVPQRANAFFSLLISCMPPKWKAHCVQFLVNEQDHFSLAMTFCLENWLQWTEPQQQIIEDAIQWQYSTWGCVSESIVKKIWKKSSNSFQEHYASLILNEMYSKPSTFYQVHFDFISKIITYSGTGMREQLVSRVGDALNARLIKIKLVWGMLKFNWGACDESIRQLFSNQINLFFKTLKQTVSLFDVFHYFLYVEPRAPKTVSYMIEFFLNEWTKIFTNTDYAYSLERNLLINFVSNQMASFSKDERKKFMKGVYAVLEKKRTIDVITVIFISWRSLWTLKEWKFLIPFFLTWISEEKTFSGAFLKAISDMIQTLDPAFSRQIHDQVIQNIKKFNVEKGKPELFQAFCRSMVFFLQRPRSEIANTIHGVFLEAFCTLSYPPFLSLVVDNQSLKRKCIAFFHRHWSQFSEDNKKEFISRLSRFFSKHAPSLAAELAISELFTPLIVSQRIPESVILNDPEFSKQRLLRLLAKMQGEIRSFPFTASSKDLFFQPDSSLLRRGDQIIVKNTPH